MVNCNSLHYIKKEIKLFIHVLNTFSNYKLQITNYKIATNYKLQITIYKSQIIINQQKYKDGHQCHDNDVVWLQEINSNMTVCGFISCSHTTSWHLLEDDPYCLFINTARWTILACLSIAMLHFQRCLAVYNPILGKINW